MNYPHSASVTSPERFHSLDALRAFALLLGVVFHAAMAFVLPPGFWAAGESSPPGFLMWFAYYTHCFRMEVFFLLAGFFACLVVGKRGVAAFLRDRARRILLVFVLALYPIKLALSSLWVAGGLSTGWLKLPPEVAALPWWQLAVGGLGLEKWPNINLAHLWFLYYLACISGLFLALRWLVGRWQPLAAALRRTADRLFRPAVSGWFAPLGLALAITPLLARMSGPDVDTPDKGFLWNLPVLLLYALFFSLGWLLHRHSDLLAGLGRRWKIHLPLSLIVSLVAGAGVGLRITGGAWAAEHATALRWATSFGTSLTMSLAVAGWIGLFVRWFASPSPWVRYLADSSYWIYLVHLPLVVALQVWWAKWTAPWWIQWPAINAVAFLILLLSYHLCVRRTWVGWLLNGRRAVRSPRDPLPSGLGAPKPATEGRV